MYFKELGPAESHLRGTPQHYEEMKGTSDDPPNLIRQRCGCCFCCWAVHYDIQQANKASKPLEDPALKPQTPRELKKYNAEKAKSERRGKRELKKSRSMGSQGAGILDLGDEDDSPSYDSAAIDVQMAPQGGDGGDEEEGKRTPDEEQG